MAENPQANLTEMQWRVLQILKSQGGTTTAEIADDCGVSYEGARQQLKGLAAARWVKREERPNPTGVGRPVGHYSLSPAGEHLFPKDYDALARDMIDAVGESLGDEALRQVLAALTDRQVAQWELKLRGMDLEERLQALRGIYQKGDPFTEVREEDGRLQLVERNCPYLNVASQRPAICSLTVSTLSRLLGHEVTRIERFQHGDGRCAFQVDPEAPIDAEEFRFEFEEAG